VKEYGSILAIESGESKEEEMTGVGREASNLDIIVTKLSERNRDFRPVKCPASSAPQM